VNSLDRIIQTEAQGSDICIADSAIRAQVVVKLDALWKGFYHYLQVLCLQYIKQKISPLTAEADQLHLSRTTSQIGGTSVVQ
jgi:hypothetical protein